MIFSPIVFIISQMFSDNNQIFAAPLAGITDRPFRRILREFAPNAKLVTEMISCHSLVEMHKNCLRNFDRYDDEGAIGAQIFGADVALMADAARILQDSGAKWIDINMGCPVPKVATRAGAGAHLMRDHVLAGKIMAAGVRAVQIPVSIKTRLGWDAEHCDWRDLINIAADCGVAFAALHGRTRAQLYLGAAVHPQIGPDVPIPIIANGDIKTLADVDAVLAQGYQGAMIGRAILGRPWVLGALSGDGCAALENVGDVVSQHLAYVLEYYGARTGVPMFRKHAAWYSAGMPNSSEFRIRVNQITDADELKSEIRKFWGCRTDI
ncbi:MAG: tRNA-dihydrouridine synthase [Lachnospiraceae bacterium]|nr:tRNA-dihydrouridine synthase [Lachnospiraceae bacterium]